MVKRICDLVDGERFTLDGGRTWHAFATLLFGNVAVYTTERRDEDAPTTRIPARRIDLVITCPRCGPGHTQTYGFDQL